MELGHVDENRLILDRVANLAMNLMSVRRPRNKIEPKNEGLNESSFEQNVDQSVIEEDSQLTSASVQFMGKSVTSAAGLFTFRWMLIILPLLPVLLLVIQNAIGLDDLLFKRLRVVENERRLREAEQLASLAVNLQDERFSIIFAFLLARNATTSDLRYGVQDLFVKTDLALNQMESWRDAVIIGHVTIAGDQIDTKLFTSRIRFQIRLDDVREKTLAGKLGLDEILQFYNLAITTLLTRFLTDIQTVEGSGTWKTLIVYQNILSGVEYVGINSAYVIKHFYTGGLTKDEIELYLKSQVLADDYLDQAANFDNEIRRSLQQIRKGDNYKNLKKIWAQVEDDTNIVNPNDVVEVVNITTSVYLASLNLQENVRAIQNAQQEVLRVMTAAEVYQFNYDFYSSICIMIGVFFFGPVIAYINQKMATSGELFIKRMTESSSRLVKEQTKSDKLLTRCLPPIVAAKLKKYKTVSQSFNACTILFSSISGFSDLVKEYTPIGLLNCLNKICEVFDHHINNFDVYKVKAINEKYMIASGVPIENGNQHVDEIAQLSLLLVRSIKTMKEGDVKFPNINIRIGIHSGNTVAGVIGSKMPRYYLYGETVEVAARMETTGTPGQIQISDATKILLDMTQYGSYDITSNGTITTVMGSRVIETFWLTSRNQDSSDTESVDESAEYNNKDQKNVG